MARKPTFDARRFVQIGIAATIWVLSVTAMQAAAGPGIRRDVRQLEQRIELRIHGDDDVAPPNAEPPERTHHDEPLEPWELVSV